MKFQKPILFLTIIVGFNVNALNLDIPSYPEGAIIPDEFTCDGSGISPQLLWSDAPEGTQSFAVVFNDETLDFLHWKLYNIGANVLHIPEDKPINIGTEGNNDFQQQSYGGPCPPQSTGNYIMTVHALNTVFDNEPTVSQLEAAAIESATWSAFRSEDNTQEKYEYSATYLVTFNTQWTEQSHPLDYPGANSAHFSPLIGNTHSIAGQIWKAAGIASDGIERMAETGSTSILSSEINNEINKGGTESRVNGSGAGSTSSVSIEITVSNSHPLFSLVTMIAPSPDWFVGVHDLDLRENGLWRKDFTVDLLPYDAGTQDGDSFENAGANTNPREPISQIVGSPFPNGIPLGTLVFERLSVSGVAPDPIFENGFE